MNSGAASGIPSNLGILDQIAALHWIQENIQVSIIITMMMMVIFMPKMLMVMVILMVIVILMAMMLIVMVILLAMMILVIFNNDHKADDCRAGFWGGPQLSDSVGARNRSSLPSLPHDF